jgi:hypothetical protein
MTYSSKLLENGSLEITTTVSREELELANTEAKAADVFDAAAPQPQFLGISFKRKTPYCVTCPNGVRTTINAYGDIHAFFMAFNQCGGAFQMSKGVC